MISNTGALPGGSQGRTTAAVAALLAVTVTTRALFMAAPGFTSDQGQFYLWSVKSRAEGLASLYKEQPAASQQYRYGCNYPPLYLLLLRVLAEPLAWQTPSTTAQVDTFYDIVKGNRTPEALHAAVFLKIPATLADAALVLLLYWWLRRRFRARDAFIVAAACAVMPVVIHNSAVWGQMDVFVTLLMVASLEMARRRRVLAMTVLAALACLTKAQALLLLPIWAGCLTPWIVAEPRRVFPILGATTVTVFPVVAPFKGHLDGLLHAYTGAADYYPFIHLNGFSAWFLANPLLSPHLGDRLSDWYVRDDVAWAIGIMPRMIGLFALLFVWGWAFTRVRRGGEAGIEWAAKVLPLAFFVLSTGMHERYLYPAIGLWAWSGLRSRREWTGWLALSAVATVNALWSWPGPGEAWWTNSALGALRTPWLGLAPGVWCSIILFIVFTVTAARPPQTPISAAA